MTIANASTHVIYLGDGATTVFPISSGDEPIHFTENSHIKGIEIDSSG